MLPPLRRILDPRTREDAQAAPLSQSVNIPFSQLPARLFELPPKSETILVAAEGELLEETLAFLHAGKRSAEACPVTFGEYTPGRLWKPNSFLLEVLSALKPRDAVDLGCGSGRDSVALASFGWKVCALDRLPSAVDQGRELASRYLSSALASNIKWRVGDFSEALLTGLIVAIRALDRTQLIDMGKRAAPGSTLVFCGFTPEHARRHGRPSPPHVFDEDLVRCALEGWTIDRLGVRSQGGAETLCVLARKL